MLPRPNRMHRSSDFTSVVRGGVRSRQGTVVVHHRGVLRGDGEQPLVGLIVSKAVGPSVVRHRVSRRLRAQLAGRLAALPPTSGTVVRALPGCADVESARLGRDLDRALGTVSGARAGGGRR